MSVTPDFLYGEPGDEYMDDDPAGVYERWEIWHDASDPEDRVPFEIEEWTSVPLSNFLPSAKAIIEWVLEVTAEEEVSEDAWDHLKGLEEVPEILAAFEKARDVLGSKITGWRQAGKLIRTLKVTWDENGEPLLDGQPMYVQRTPE